MKHARSDIPDTIATRTATRDPPTVRRNRNMFGVLVPHVCRVEYAEVLERERVAEMRNAVAGAIRDVRAVGEPCARTGEESALR